MTQGCDSILRSAFGFSMAAVWQHLTIALSQARRYEARTEIFFCILERLLDEGHVKLAHDGKFLGGTIKEQIEVLRMAWPKFPGEDDLDGFGYWFLIDAPAGLVWITDDGREAWT